MRAVEEDTGKTQFMNLIARRVEERKGRRIERGKTEKKREGCGRETEGVWGGGGNWLLGGEKEGKEMEIAVVN